ncbi:hypothetical protein K7X08_035317 [Anisodus acutangulus]|uniref:Pentatricopeptide repeat-containing protein n=1 Tax=Anisodus acutangulus TaxID=402998 RepID=A0A9Q1LIT5_9SOLA|nr:hypothetical protein K7X08_035317 [Anisodus acutangulus]
MVGGLSQNGYDKEAIEILYKMQAAGFQPNAQTLASILPACGRLQMLYLGKEIHGYLTRHELMSNSFVVNGLIDVYRRCGDMENALLVFSMYSMKNDLLEHHVLRKEEIEADSFTLGSALAACADMGLLRRGKEIHSYAIARGLQTDPFVGGALVELYSQCLDVGAAQKAFDEMKADGFDPNIYTWNSIIAGHVKNAHNESALQLFSDTHIGSAVVDVYAKCGCVKHARLAYDNIKKYNLVTENAMLTAYAMHGYGEEGIAFFRRILDNGFIPDDITFLSALSSCVHARLVETGLEFFNLMRSYNVKPTLKHYTCIVDLFSRTGKLKAALKVIKEMPLDPDAVIWGALLGGCVIHGNLEPISQSLSKDTPVSEIATSLRLLDIT